MRDQRLEGLHERLVRVGAALFGHGCEERIERQAVGDVDDVVDHPRIEGAQVTQDKAGMRRETPRGAVDGAIGAPRGSVVPRVFGAGRGAERAVATEVADGR